MKLLLTGAFKYSQDELSTIISMGYDVTFVQDERVSLEVDISEFEGVVCNSLFLYNDITRFTKLKFIQLISAGTDRVPLEYIGKTGIRLYNAYGVYSVPMSEWVILKLLEIYKKSKIFYINQANHKWNKQYDVLELTDKVAAIVGVGNVGQEVAKRLKAFNVKIIGIDIKKPSIDTLDEYYFIGDIDRALQKSDIIILSLPLTPDTRHLIDRSKLNIMKDKSVLINVSRGGIIDEKSLIESIKSGKFLGVALDVFEEEPLSDNSILWDCENVIITPHNSYISDKTHKRMFELIVKNLKNEIDSVI